MVTKPHVDVLPPFVPFWNVRSFRLVINLLLVLPRTIWSFWVATAPSPIATELFLAAAAPKPSAADLLPAMSQSQSQHRNQFLLQLLHHW